MLISICDGFEHFYEWLYRKDLLKKLLDKHKHFGIFVAIILLVLRIICPIFILLLFILFFPLLLLISAYEIKVKYGLGYAFVFWTANMVVCLLIASPALIAIYDAYTGSNSTIEENFISESTNNIKDEYYTLHVDTTPPGPYTPSKGDYIEDTSLDKYLETDVTSPLQELNASEILILKTEKVHCGDMASILVKVEPNTEYYIAVYYKSGRSSADGLHKKISDKSGKILWSWRVGSRTHAGEYRIEIYNSEKKYVTSFIVK